MGRGSVSEDTDLELVKEVVGDQNHHVILVVRLESSNPLRRRYLLIVSAPSLSRGVSKTSSLSSTSILNSSPSKSQVLDYCLIGVDSIYRRNESEDTLELVSVSVGFVLKMLWGFKVSLDGDGGFSVRQLGKHFVFKPKTVQALWTAIQTLHLTSTNLKPKRHSVCLGDSDWVKEYERRISSPQTCINEWNDMPDILVRREPSADELSRLSSDDVDLETKKSLIKSKLRQIMKTVDLDDITSKSIRNSLEAELNQNLDQFKAFIDQEILIILGQMDPASQVFDFLYLGSEWNASNLEELNSNGVTHILNVTREIDNFFPSGFQYLNVREYDVEDTDLLKYWDKTYLFIKDCLSQGGRVLVHCKMGISRSASTVVAFGMKYFDWSMEESLDHVKRTRSIIEPNNGFRNQLQVYEGILQASKKRTAFRKQRSKSESNASDEPCSLKKAPRHPGPSPAQLSSSQENLCDITSTPAKSQEKKDRPKSWSPSPTNCTSTTSTITLSPSLEREPIICHCYTELAQHFSHNNVFPSNIGGRRSSDINSSINDETFSAVVEASNIQVRQLGTRSSLCPAKSHIDQCTCNLELELKVPELPIEVSARIECEETDLILKNLGNLPIHIREAQTKTNVVFRDWKNCDPDLCNYGNDALETDLMRDSKPFSLDQSGAEELSVKTLADMFDFKLGEEPAKPRLTSRHNKLVESKINEIAQKLGITDFSEC